MNRSKVALVVFVALFLVVPLVNADLPLENSVGVKNTNSTSGWTSSKSYSGLYSIHLDAGSNSPSGDEARLTITFPKGITLGDLETVSWYVYTIAGYPPHLDITLDIDGDSIVDPEDMLTAEIAVNNPSYNPPTYGNYSLWLRTLELNSSDGCGIINNNTIFWVTKMGGGDKDAPSSILSNWKQGTVDLNPDTLTPDPDLTGIINSSAPLIKIEIEIDNWIAASEAFIDDIEINGINILGIVGPTGTTGPKGDTGETGDTGPQGDQGEQGDTGSTGPEGLQGDTGDIGIQGPEGPLGDKGDTGDVGPNGDIGDTGPQGDKGEQGQTGPRGTSGPPGSRGPRGTEGPIGSQGPLGPEGPQGEPGLIGLQGEQGEPGNASEQGQVGPIGPQGSPGETGGKGDPGKKGDEGTQGPQGEMGPEGVVPVWASYGTVLGAISLIAVAFLFVMENIR